MQGNFAINPDPLNENDEDKSPSEKRINNYQMLLNETEERNIEPFLSETENDIIMVETFGHVLIRLRKKIKNNNNEYTLIKFIGNGAFSIVELASKGDQKYAIKIEPVEFLIQLNELESTIREVEILKSLDCQYIIKCHESFTFKNDEGKEYFAIVMEYCEGDTLLEYVQNHQKDADYPRRIRQILYSVSKAIKYIHKKGISHGDIKSENILLDRNLNPKLIDFGFAQKCKILPNGRQNYTESYAAPEIIKGGPFNTFQADIWSLGVTIYTTVTGSFPFDADKSIKDQILKGEIEKDLPGDIGELYVKCVHPDPTKRPTIKQILLDTCFHKR